MARMRTSRIDFQTPTATETTAKSDVVKTTDYGVVKRGTFSITVKGDEIDPETKKDKVLYTNDEEPFEYEQVNSLANALVHAGAKLEDNQITFLGQALVSKDAEISKGIGEAVAKLTSIYNAKLKADAKSNAYQALVNKYKPLEGEKKESAQARLVANFIKLAGVSKEIAVAQLKTAKALPEDYTVADFDATPLRRTKGDSDE